MLPLQIYGLAVSVPSIWQVIGFVGSIASTGQCNLLAPRSLLPAQTLGHAQLPPCLPAVPSCVVTPPHPAVPDLQYCGLVHPILVCLTRDLMTLMASARVRCVLPVPRHHLLHLRQVLQGPRKDRAPDGGCHHLCHRALHHDQWGPRATVKQGVLV